MRSASASNTNLTSDKGALATCRQGRGVRQAYGSTTTSSRIDTSQLFERKISRLLILHEQKNSSSGVSLLQIKLKTQEQNMIHTRARPEQATPSASRPPAHALTSAIHHLSHHPPTPSSQPSPCSSSIHPTVTLPLVPPPIPPPLSPPPIPMRSRHIRAVEHVPISPVHRARRRHVLCLALALLAPDQGKRARALGGLALETGLGERRRGCG